MHGPKDGGERYRGMTATDKSTHSCGTQKLTSLSERSQGGKLWTDEGSGGEALCKDIGCGHGG